MSDAEREGPDPSFIKLGAGRGITKKTMQSLYDSGVRNKSELADMPERQMRDLDIPAAQKFRLRKLVEDILVARPNETPEDVTGANGAGGGGGGTETMIMAADGSGSDAASTVTATDSDAASSATAATGEDGGKKTNDPLLSKDTLLNKMMRPHEDVFGDKTKDGNFLQFLYANLLTLENLYRTDRKESVGYLNHLHFLTLKLMQQYPSEQVFRYDHAVRRRIDAGELCWSDRVQVALDSDLVREHFEEEHLQKWKKMRRLSTKNMTDIFKTDRCLSWNYSKDGSDCTKEECKYAHSCLACGGGHTLIKCPTNTSERKERKKAMFKDLARDK